MSHDANIVTIFVDIKIGNCSICFAETKAVQNFMVKIAPEPILKPK